MRKCPLWPHIKEIATSLEAGGFYRHILQTSSPRSARIYVIISQTLAPTWKCSDMKLSPTRNHGPGFDTISLSWPHQTCDFLREGALKCLLLLLGRIRMGTWWKMWLARAGLIHPQEGGGLDSAPLGRVDQHSRCMHDCRCTYGSVSAGREKWPFNVLFFFKSRASVWPNLMR